MRSLMSTTIIWAGTLIAVTGMICFALLKGWRSWIELRRLEVTSRRAPPEPPELPPAVRIEMAHLKERLRKLEAIARGVDL
jgi:hypothetical protein